MRKITVARWCSIAGHPFAFIILLVAIASWRLLGGHQAFAITAIVIATMLVPLGLFVWHRHSSGRWETVDASARAERPALYKAIFIILLPTGLYFLIRARGSEMTRGVVATAVLFGVAAALNHWIKLSLHLTMATFAAVIITKLVPVLGGILLAFLPILAWSRMMLSRHSIAEVLAGFMLGLTVATVTLFV